jgi:hypothetical protein
MLDQPPVFLSSGPHHLEIEFEIFHKITAAIGGEVSVAKAQRPWKAVVGAMSIVSSIN